MHSDGEGGEDEYDFDKNHVYKPMYSDGEEIEDIPEKPNENYIDDDITFDDEVNDAYDLIHSDSKEMDVLPQYLSKALESLKKGI